MTTISIESPDPTPKVSKATPTSRTSAPLRQVEQSDAKRFDGQPVTQWVRLQRAMEELLFYRVSSRHHTANETNEPRSHERWQKEAVALLRSVADGIVQGSLEPEPVKKAAPEPEDMDGIQW